MISIKKNIKPNLKVCQFVCDTKLDAKLDKHDLTKFLNRHSVNLIIGKPASGKTNLLYSFFKSKDLLKFIRVSYLEFIVQDRTDIFELEIVCWFNFLREGETVEEHIHGAAHDSYLSGNIHLDDYETQTYYRCPQEPNLVFNSSNIKGGLTIFPSHMPHGATTYNETKPRISIAFDLRVMPDDNRLDYCSRPFMNPEIYSELVDEFKSQTYQELEETNN